MRNAAADPAPRAGFVLPFVVVATALAALLALAAVSMSWRGYRATRLAANGVRAQFAGDEGVAILLDAWPAESLAAQAPGTTISTRVTTAAGDSVRVRVTRTQPLVAWLTADVRLASMGTPGRIHRQVTRVLSLEPPTLPIIGALTAFSAVHAQAPTTIDGRDRADPTDACGAARDTLSRAPIAAPALPDGPTGPWLWPSAALILADPAKARVAFDAAWRSVIARSASLASDSTPRLLVPLPGWHALSLQGARVALRAPSRWRGMLAVAGDLVVTGTLELDGVLLVRGRLDARGAVLRVRGAILVASVGDPVVELGDRTQLRYDQCAVQLALATVSLPRAQPFSLWYSPVH